MSNLLNQFYQHKQSNFDRLLNDFIHNEKVGRKDCNPPKLRTIQEEKDYSTGKSEYYYQFIRSKIKDGSTKKGKTSKDFETNLKLVDFLLLGTILNCFYFCSKEEISKTLGTKLRDEFGKGVINTDKLPDITSGNYNWFPLFLYNPNKGTMSLNLTLKDQVEYLASGHPISKIGKHSISLSQITSGKITVKPKFAHYYTNEVSVPQLDMAFCPPCVLQGTQNEVVRYYEKGSQYHWFIQKNFYGDPEPYVENNLQLLKKLIIDSFNSDNLYQDMVVFRQKESSDTTKRYRKNTLGDYKLKMDHQRTMFICFLEMFEQGMFNEITSKFLSFINQNNMEEGMRKYILPKVRQYANNEFVKFVEMQREQKKKKFNQKIEDMYNEPDEMETDWTDMEAASKALIDSQNENLLDVYNQYSSVLLEYGINQTANSSIQQHKDKSKDTSYLTELLVNEIQKKIIECHDDYDAMAGVYWFDFEQTYGPLRIRRKKYSTLGCGKYDWHDYDENLPTLYTTYSLEEGNFDDALLTACEPNRASDWRFKHTLTFHELKKLAKHLGIIK